jgi:hypothetical protein
MSLKVPSLSVCARPAVPKWALGADLFYEACCRPSDVLVSKVWFLSGLLKSWAGLPALGSVHLGKSCLVEGLEEASGTYRPGPTAAGVAV